MFFILLYELNCEVIQLQVIYQQRKIHKAQVLPIFFYFILKHVMKKL